MLIRGRRTISRLHIDDPILLHSSSENVCSVCVFLFGHVCVLFLGPRVGWWVSGWVWKEGRKEGRKEGGREGWSEIYLDACEHMRTGCFFECLLFMFNNITCMQEV
jgi:hypothetical protein